MKDDALDIDKERSPDKADDSTAKTDTSKKPKVDTTKDKATASQKTQDASETDSKVDASKDQSKEAQPQQEAQSAEP